MDQNIEKIYDENERDFLLTKKGSKDLFVLADCRICGLEFKTKLKRLQKGFLCRKCKISQTKKSVDEKTKKEINEKRKQTCLEKYGVSNVFQLEETKEKSTKSLEEKYGVSNPRYLQLDENYQKKIKDRKQKEIEVQSDDKKDEHFENLKNMKVSKWDFRTDAERSEIINKRKKTNLKKYGVEFAQQNDNVKRKTRENSLKKWGFEYPQQNSSFREKIENTFLEKYGARHPNFAYKFQNQMFDSSWELAVWIWANDHSIPIKREPAQIEYEFKGVKHTYYPDFEIDGKIVEVKGPQFFKEGKLVNPFDHSKNEIYNVKYQCALKNGVEFWSTKEMKPILNYIEGKYTKDFLDLFKLNLPFPYPQISSKTDLNVLRYFHKSLYWASRKNCKSPYEAWNDKDLVLKSALNRLKYIGRCTPEDVIGGFSVARIAPKVSIFKPSKAIEIIKKYLGPFETIVDPFSGFSGRMVGSFRCGKTYIGRDINEDHVRESNEIKEYLNIQNAEVFVENLLEAPKREFKNAALFTCPPYGGKEHWNENNDEVEKSCDEWIDICLEKYKCNSYVFVVDQTEKYKDKIVDTITNKSHLGTNYEYVILFRNM